MVAENDAIVKKLFVECAYWRWQGESGGMKGEQRIYIKIYEMSMRIITGGRKEEFDLGEGQAGLLFHREGG